MRRECILNVKKVFRVLKKTVVFPLLLLSKQDVREIQCKYTKK